uniref:Uncharacterized protein n=1 Tax=Cucumis melo TaxID=3656 RepID=A0A9I9EHW0_CUCME
MKGIGRRSLLSYVGPRRLLRRNLAFEEFELIPTAFRPFFLLLSHLSNNLTNERAIQEFKLKKTFNWE